MSILYITSISYHHDNGDTDTTMALHNAVIFSQTELSKRADTLNMKTIFISDK